MPFIPRSPRKPYQKPRQAFEGFEANKTAFYSNAPWRKLRKMFLQQNPLCVKCAENGKVKESTTVDHIKSINKEDPYNTEFGKYGEALNPINLQALCHECHNSKSGKTKNKVK